MKRLPFRPFRMSMTVMAHRDDLYETAKHVRQFLMFDGDEANNPVERFLSFEHERINLAMDVDIDGNVHGYACAARYDEDDNAIPVAPFVIDADDLCDLQDCVRNTLEDIRETLAYGVADPDYKAREERIEKLLDRLNTIKEDLGE